MQPQATIYRLSLRGTPIELLGTPGLKELLYTLESARKIVALQDSFFIHEDPAIFNELLSYFESGNRATWKPSNLRLHESLSNSAITYQIDGLSDILNKIREILSIVLIVDNYGEVALKKDLNSDAVLALDTTGRFLRARFSQQSVNLSRGVTDVSSTLIFSMYEDGYRFNGSVSFGNEILLNFSAK